MHARGAPGALQALCRWLNEKAKPALMAKLDRRGINGASEERVRVAGDGYRLTASPLRSYGYLYMVAEPDPRATAPLPEQEEARHPGGRRARPRTRPAGPARRPRSA